MSAAIRTDPDPDPDPLPDRTDPFAAPRVYYVIGRARVPGARPEYVTLTGRITYQDVRANRYTEAEAALVCEFFAREYPLYAWEIVPCHRDLPKLAVVTRSATTFPGASRPRQSRGWKSGVARCTGKGSTKSGDYFLFVKKVSLGRFKPYKIDDPDYRYTTEVAAYAAIQVLRKRAGGYWRIGCRNPDGSLPDPPTA